jgi:hypothetical protein
MVRMLVIAGLLLTPVLCEAQEEGSTSVAGQLAAHLKLAESAFKNEDWATAEREYRAALKLDPDQSGAVFRLAQLMRSHNADESERLFRRYLELEPADAWGYIVLAELLSRTHRFDEAFSLYRQARNLAPGERDVVIGEARLAARTQHTGRAIELYQQWLKTHPEDKDAWEGLASEYWRAGRPMAAFRALDHTSEAKWVNRKKLYERTAAPLAEPLFRFTRDSDGYMTRRVTLGGDVAILDGVRFGLSAGRTTASIDADWETASRGYSTINLHSKLRPVPSLRLEASGGLARIDGTEAVTGSQDAASLTPTANMRLRWRAPENGHRFEARFDRTLLDSTPTLLANEVVRNQLKFRPDLALSRRLRLYADASGSLLTGRGHRNVRNSLGTGVGWSLNSEIVLSANRSVIGYRRASRVGYFAPQRIETYDFGSYMDFEGSKLVMAFDFGGGVERLRKHGEPFGAWRRAFRGYAYFSYPVQPGRFFNVELEAYNTLAAPAAAVSSGWKYVSLTFSFRASLPGL